jgi:hypothetical protein
MIAALTPTRRFQAALRGSLRRICPSLSLFTLLILFPALALAQSPFDTGFTAMQTPLPTLADDLEYLQKTAWFLMGLVCSFDRYVA